LTARYPKVAELLAQGQKHCPRCVAIKPLAEFYRSSQTKSGRAGLCKQCDNARRKKERLTPEGKKRRRIAYHKAKTRRSSRVGQSKQCNRCKETKPATCFEYNPQQRDGMRATCRQCLAPANAKRSRVYKAQQRANDPVKFRLVQRGKQYVRRYGLNEGDFERMNDTQNGKCAICANSPDPKKRFLDIDHDHKSGKVRELLCTNCNTGLGRFRDDPDILIKAVNYLLKHRQLKLAV